ncbi:MAG: right-handed parallel beta-helix repeat-containing protein, partial [Polyangiales bacterium]
GIPPTTCALELVMRTSVFAMLRALGLLFAGTAFAVLFVRAPHAAAFNGILSDWQDFYNPPSASGDSADCQLCHIESNGGEPFNAYGWALLLALEDPDSCDIDDPPDNLVSNVEAFLCVEVDNSDSDATGSDNLTEIEASTQPGWTEDNLNTYYWTTMAPLQNQQAPGDIGALDPSGAGGMGGSGGLGGAGGTGGVGGNCPPDSTIPPEQIGDGTILVKPGQSIQEAIDLSEGPTRIEIEPGIYEEPCNPINGLNITKSGIHLLGLSTPEERVIVKHTGDQRNGMVIVPPEVPAAAQPLFGPKVQRTDCMGCHSDMGPPFPLHPYVPKVIPLATDPWLIDIVVEGITVQGFGNNGIFTEHVDGFVLDDVESIDNLNYGIFPVLSRNGVIRDSHSTGSTLDSGLWVETSENVQVIGNLVENSVNGIEVSNSDDVLLMDNESRDNTIGAAILLLPDIYENRDSAKRIDLQNNWLHDNNKPNTARPGSILSFIPSGMGILYVGVDESEASANLVENNDFAGIAVVDYCLPFLGTPFSCSDDPTVSPEFILDQTAENNRIVDNDLVNNGNNADPESDFARYAGDLVLLTGDDHDNCFSNNDYTTSFSTLGELPPCPEEPGTGGTGGAGGAGAGGDGGSGGTGGTETNNGGGGCSVGTAAGSRSSTAWLLLLGGAWALSRRRRLRQG